MNIDQAADSARGQGERAMVVEGKETAQARGKQTAAELDPATGTVHYWTDARRPMPDVPTVDGLTFQGYEDALTTENLLTKNSCKWTAAVVDQRSGYYGGVTSGFGQATWYFVGNSDGLVSVRTTGEWPWDAGRTVGHLIAWHVFRDAHREGRTGQYWTLPHADARSQRPPARPARCRPTPLPARPAHAGTGGQWTSPPGHRSITSTVHLTYVTERPSSS